MLVLCVAVGVLVGLVAAWRKEATRFNEGLLAAEKRLREEAEKLAALHNQAVKEHKALTDKLAAHEYALNARRT